MPGQIIPRGERTWLVRVYAGRDPQTGKRSLETMTPEERTARAKKAAAKSAEVRSKKAAKRKKG